MTFSKGDIDRLGNDIRSEYNNLGDSSLEQLQAYRTSHKEVLSLVFTMLCFNNKKVNRNAITTYRIKRFESIIGKLNRYPSMRFSRMWDIGGCRCILKTNEDVYKLKSIISQEKDFEIIKEYDYIAKPETDGYKSLHLFIKHISHTQIIEVQLRNQIDHNWATLVEITDVLFGSKLKELGDNIELKRFHFLLSKLSELEISEKKEISQTLADYNYFEKLSEVFSRNYLKVRRQWFEVGSSNHKYFMIESNKDQVPKIESFRNSQEAEEIYFNIYKSKKNANIVLTHLQSPNYEQISIAYSNYILTFHSFLNESYDILESLIMASLQNGNYLDYFKFFKRYNEIVYNHVRNLMSEIVEVSTYSQDSRKNKRREKEWINEIQKQINQSKERRKKLARTFQHNMPTGFLGKLIVTRITKHIEKKYQKKIMNLVPKNSN